MCDRVKEATQHAWKGYNQYAEGYDDLMPLSKKGRNWYKVSMSMTPMDAYDTFILMGLKEEAEQAQASMMNKFNFDLDNDVQVFEVTIRLLGSLLSAYESEGNKQFLSLAEDLGQRLLPAFKTPTGMPYRFVNLHTGNCRDSINNPAEIGTLTLEFGKLSEFTGDKTYYEVAKKATLAVFERRSALDLVGEAIDVKTGKWTNTSSHISGCIDSYYEYLYKSWLLFGDKDFKKAFDIHQKAIKKYLICDTENGSFVRQVNMNTGIEISSNYGALDAFYTGLCVLEGDILLAKNIQKANFSMWNTFGMEPEEYNFKTQNVTNAQYHLRPENLESCFYLYRSTKNEQYLWEGKRMVDDILKNCRSEVGFASIKDLKTMEKMDVMHSFLFAETLKYAYLLFAPDASLDLKKYVLNTEAHAFLIAKK